MFYFPPVLSVRFQKFGFFLHILPFGTCGLSGMILPLATISGMRRKCREYMASFARLRESCMRKSVERLKEGGICQRNVLGTCMVGGTQKEIPQSKDYQGPISIKQKPIIFFKMMCTYTKTMLVNLQFIYVDVTN